MGELLQPGQEPPGGMISPRRRGSKTILVLVLCCVLVAAFWVAVQTVNKPTTAALDAPSTTAPADPSGSATATAAPSESTAPLKTSQATGKAAPTSKAAASKAPATQAAKPSVGPTAGASASKGAPGPGVSNDAHLATVQQPVAKPVRFDESSTIATGLSAAVKDIAAVEGVAQGVGEIAGPSIRFTVVIENKTAKPMSTIGAVVTVDYGKAKSPAAQLSGPGATDFPASVAPGASASATFVFNVPADQRGQVRVFLNLQATSPIAAFEGAVSSSKGKS